MTVLSLQPAFAHIGRQCRDPLPEGSGPMPPLFERQGLGTAVMSYDGRLCWCILADRDVVPDLGLLARDVDAALRELRGAARRSSRSRPGR
jgi:hypothetical protein